MLRQTRQRSLNQLFCRPHVWLLDQGSVDDPEKLEACVSVLSKDELKQYRRFHIREDQHRYLVSHALVRHVLSEYVDLPPHAWEYLKNPHGRPEIANPDIPELRFNLTHTDGLTACIVSYMSRCGIDAERLKTRYGQLGVAKRTFSRTEYAQILDLPDHLQNAYFYQHWTLREAYVKACGTGLWAPGEKFGFSVTSPDNIKLETSHGSERWKFELRYPTNDHLVAIAVEREPDHDIEIQSRWFSF